MAFQYSFRKYPKTQLFEPDTVDPVYAPLLPITLENPNSGIRIKTIGVFDTGADDSLCPGSIAAQLGHDLDHEDADRTGICGAGSEFYVFMHTMKVSILSEDETDCFMSNTIQVGCSNHCPFLLLGRSLFESCTAQIDFKSQTFTLAKSS